MPPWKMIKLKLHKLTIGKKKPECIEPNNWKCSKRLLPKDIPSKQIHSVSLTPLSSKCSHGKLHPSQVGSLSVSHHPMTASLRELLEEQGLQMLGPTQVAPDDKEILGVRGKLHKGRSSQPSGDAAKLSSFTDLICKKILKTGFYLTKWKKSRRKDINIAEESVKISRQIGKSEKTTNNKAMQEGDGIELCKKKILMGEKCRPLHKSGTLHYDENGVLLPEET